jgi:hypothetical protein
MEPEPEDTPKMPPEAPSSKEELNVSAITNFIALLKRLKVTPKEFDWLMTIIPDLLKEKRGERKIETTANALAPLLESGFNMLMNNERVTMLQRVSVFEKTALEKLPPSCFSLEQICEMGTRGLLHIIKVDEGHARHMPNAAFRTSDGVLLHLYINDKKGETKITVYLPQTQHQPQVAPKELPSSWIRNLVTAVFGR